MRTLLRLPAPLLIWRDGNLFRRRHIAVRLLAARVRLLAADGIRRQARMSRRLSRTNRIDRNRVRSYATAHVIEFLVLYRFLFVAH